MIIGTIIQQSTEMLDYQVDFSSFFEGSDDYIANATVTVEGSTASASDYYGYASGRASIPLYATAAFIPPSADIVLDDFNGYSSITIESDPTPYTVKFFLYGGKDGDKAKVTVRITTRLNRVKEEEIKIKIKDI